MWTKQLACLALQASGIKSIPKVRLQPAYHFSQCFGIPSITGNVIPSIYIQGTGAVRL